MQLPLTQFRGLYKPPGVPRINPLHPAASHIAGCFLFNGIKTYDISGYYAPTNIVLGTPVIQAGRIGQFLDFGSSSYVALGKQISGAMSGVVIAMVKTLAGIPVAISTGANGAQNGICMQLGNNFGSNTSLYVTSFTGFSPIGTTEVWVNGTDYGAGNNNPVPTLVLAANTWYCIGFTSTAVPAGDGNMTFGNFTVGGGGTMSLSAAFFFNKVLPPGVMAGLTTNPMSLLIWPDDDLLAFDMVGMATLVFRSRAQMIA